MIRIYSELVIKPSDLGATVVADCDDETLAFYGRPPRK